MTVFLPLIETLIKLPGENQPAVLIFGGLQVVIDILNRHVGFDSENIHGIEFQHDHGAGGILCERLVDFQADIFTGLHTAFNQMAFNYFLGRFFFTKAPFCGRVIIN